MSPLTGQAVYQNSSRASNAEFSLQSLNQATFSLLKILGICSLASASSMANNSWWKLQIRKERAPKLQLALNGKDRLPRNMFSCFRQCRRWRIGYLYISVRSLMFCSMQWLTKEWFIDYHCSSPALVGSGLHRGSFLVCLAMPHANRSYYFHVCWGKDLLSTSHYSLQGPTNQLHTITRETKDW